MPKHPVGSSLGPDSSTLLTLGCARGVMAKKAPGSSQS